MKWKSLAEQLLLVTVLHLDVIAQATIRVATEGAYAPWNFKPPGGQLDGYDIDVARDLCRRMGLKVEIITQDFDSLIPDLKAKKFDAIIAAMSITSKRKEIISFTRPYAWSADALTVMSDGPLANMPGTKEIWSLDDQSEQAQNSINKMAKLLKGKTIGVQGSTTASTFLHKYFKDVAEIREYSTVDQHNLDLTSGRIDAVFCNIMVMAELQSKPEMTGTQFAGPFFYGGGFGSIGIGLRKKDKALKNKFDVAIAAAIRDGTLKKLSMKWFRVDFSPM